MAGQVLEEGNEPYNSTLKNVSKGSLESNTNKNKKKHHNYQQGAGEHQGPCFGEETEDS